jgi:uncharacterized phage protein (TIGR01671 family)
MNRFKFKAWNKKTNKMIDLYKLTPLALDSRLNQDGVFIPFDEDFQILQFTGLSDKNGRDIFEGDIIDNGKKHTPSKGAVVYSQASFRVCCIDEESGIYNMLLTGQMCSGKVEIIGNIYENKSLLEKTNGQNNEASPA